MCRDGYRAICKRRHCAEVTTCRDTNGWCREHDPLDFDLWDDDETNESPDEPIGRHAA